MSNEITMTDVQKEMAAANAAIHAGYGGSVESVAEIACPKCGATTLHEKYERWTTRRGYPMSSTTLTCTAPGCDYRHYRT